MPESSRMTESYSLSELEAIIRRVTDSGGEFELYPKGTSMLPLILEGRDSVILSCLPDELTAGDVVLYRRDDGSYVLHRIIGCDGGTYTMCGDNQYNAEPGIRRDQMIAFASAFARTSAGASGSGSGAFFSFVKILESAIILFLRFVFL